MKIKHYIVFALTVFLLSGCAFLASPAKNNVSTGSGSFRMYRPSGVFEHGSREKKVVALTFDADMTPKMKKELEKGAVKSWFDEKIPEILERNHVPATIFITGMWAEMYPDEVKKLAANPLYEIGNHSYDHAAFHTPCYGLLETKDKEEEIIKTQKILQSLTGVFPKYFRFPGGCGIKTDVDLVSDLGMQVVGWDDISGDAYIRDHAEPIISRTISQAKNGSIVVMHFHGGTTAPQTSRALQGIIDGLRKRGFEFVKVSDLDVSQK
ncbi:MAG: polysaccharide deacetylase family protein [Candidatus Gracilibacteria bacterium]